MKKTSLLSTIATLLIASQSLVAQNVIAIKANKATKPLIEKWAEAYSAVRPDVKIEVVSGNQQANLSLVYSRTEDENTTYVGRYAILPVTPADNPILDELTKSEWKEKDLTSLFFVNDEYDDDDNNSKKSKIASKLTVYSGNSKTSASNAFAAHFGRTSSEIKGKKIAGDDAFLINAISKDKESVTFSQLTNIYDLQTRTLRSDLALIPLSAKKNTWQLIANGSLDDVLKIIEAQPTDLITVEEFGLTYNNDLNSATEAFLRWVVTDGQVYNNQIGFLPLTEREARAQVNNIDSRSATANLLARNK